MRLIDADAFYKKIIDMQDTHEISCKVLEELRNFPTAYDVENVIEQINDTLEPTNQYRHKFCGTVTDDHCAKHEDCEYCIAERITDIVKTAINKRERRLNNGA